MILVLMKRDDFQMIMVPCEAPIEGMNSKASNVEGQCWWWFCQHSGWSKMSQNCDIRKDI